MKELEEVADIIQNKLSDAEKMLEAAEAVELDNTTIATLRGEIMAYGQVMAIVFKKHK